MSCCIYSFIIGSLFRHYVDFSLDRYRLCAWWAEWDANMFLSFQSGKKELFHHIVDDFQFFFFFKLFGCRQTLCLLKDVVSCWSLRFLYWGSTLCEEWRLRQNPDRWAQWVLCFCKFAEDFLETIRNF